MKNINKDFKYRDRRRPKFSNAERGLILVMLISGAGVLAVLSVLFYILSN